MIPLFVSKPEPVSKVRVITIKEQLEHTVKTLHKAGIHHIEVSTELETVDHSALGNDLHTTYDSLTHIDNIIICLQTGKYAYLEENIELIYPRSFRESDISSRFVTVRWN